MFNESLLFKQEHEEKAEVIVSDILYHTVPTKTKSCNPRLRVSVGGISGSGKSEVCWWVRQKLYRANKTCHVINLDRFYIISEKNRKEIRERYKIIGVEELKIDEINDEIEFWKGQDRFDILVLDGLYANYFDTNLRVFLNSDPEKSYEFRKIRGKENPDCDHRRWVFEQECKAVDSLKERANLIL